LSEGINSPKNKYKNILIDFFYNNISSKIILTYPIAIVFGIKQAGYKINDLTRTDIHNYKKT
jgi:hypothetical protein